MSGSEQPTETYGAPRGATPGHGQPVLRVVKGEPTPDEFAALVAVISAKLRTTPVQQERQGATGRWAAYWRRTRQPLRPGPNAWRASGLPRA